MNSLSTTKTVDLLLRYGLAFAFIYPPVAAFFDPYSWVGYFPVFVTALLPIEPLFLLHVFGVFELLIGAWLVFGKNVFIPSLLAALSLVGIIIFNLNQLDVLFRDIPILFMAVCLIVLYKKSHNS